MNNVELTGFVDSPPRLQTTTRSNILRFDLRHDVEAGGVCSETVTPVRMFGPRATDLARRLKQGHPLKITGILAGEKFQDNRKRTRFHVFVEAREILVGEQS